MARDIVQHQEDQQVDNIVVRHEEKDRHQGRLTCDFALQAKHATC